jgi:hypothetical protein
VPGVADNLPGGADAVRSDAITDSVPADRDGMPAGADRVPGDSDAVPWRTGKRDGDAVSADANRLSGSARDWAYAMSGGEHAMPRWHRTDAMPDVQHPMPGWNADAMPGSGWRDTVPT